ncbi:MAG: carbamoyltransferase HypF [Kineosporiaceae bacterium]
MTRRLVRVRGVVQGVGFRPFVATLAGELRLAGTVRNDPDGVLADVQGDAAAVEAFCRRVRGDAPPLALVESVTWRASADEPDRSGFAIVSSGSGPGRTLAPPDVATCADCLREFVDPADRRHRHPFIACTNCGPRFTIIRSLPYDRPATTMDRFPMCPACRTEYTDPADRRYHAQPIACHDCGPRLAFHDSGRGAAGEEALAAARTVLAGGGIVAIKGVGGYHLACDATDAAAVRRLRERKRRGDKPFAVLVRDVATARRFVAVADAEARLLASPQAPIVLLRRLPPGAATLDVADAVAPGNPDVGVMLPPTALHHLVLGTAADPPGPPVLVLTSGNLSGEPIVTDDDDARRRLAGIADAWLAHDRPIHVPCDDSVTRVVDGEEAPLRRSRGFAPLPVTLPVPVDPVLATGGDLKNTLAIADGTRAWLSAHVGDMDDLATQDAAERARTHLEALLGVTPQAVVTDAHPRYRSAAWGRRVAAAGGLPVATVQHHHAHVASVMAEHGVPTGTPVVGVAFDGTGYGDDGAVWGGELLLATYEGYERRAHLSYVGLAGGDAAVRRTYRMALAQLSAAGVPWDPDLPPVAACPPDERRVLARQLEVGLAVVPTSSAGRLFDAVASIAGLCHESVFEAQAAMALEAAAVGAGGVDAEVDPYPLPLVDGQWRCEVLVREAVADVRAGAAPELVAARFHRGLARAAADGAAGVAAAAGVDRVALSGGVFANALLSTLVARRLREAGLRVLRQRRVPATDGGLALGQIAVAAARSARVRPHPADRGTPTARGT